MQERTGKQISVREKQSKRKKEKENRTKERKRKIELKKDIGIESLYEQTRSYDFIQENMC